MALAVFLRGVNVGGHRTFRPSVLAKQLARYDVVNIGAAGTFVVRKPVSQAELRAALLRRLPFDAEVMICSAADVDRLASGDPFAGMPARADVIRFVGVLANRARRSVTMPLSIPTEGEWGVKVLTRDGRFVCGVYRRQMKAIGYLGRLDKIFGVPITIRNWNTIQLIARVARRPIRATGSTVVKSPSKQ